MHGSQSRQVNKQVMGMYGHKSSQYISQYKAGHDRSSQHVGQDKASCKGGGLGVGRGVQQVS